MIMFLCFIATSSHFKGNPYLTYIIDYSLSCYIHVMHEVLTSFKVLQKLHLLYTLYGMV